MKTVANTYLYSKYPNYEKSLLDFVMTGERIDKDDKAFEDIKYEVKRCPISNNLIKVLTSNKVVLIIGNKPLTKAFKVIAMKDVKTDRQLKIFIDCTNLISNNGSEYKCNNINVLVSYLISATNTMIYSADPKRLLNNTSFISTSAECFTKLFTYIIDYLYKISVSDTNIKDKCKYLAAMYYHVNILERDRDSESVASSCRKISNISTREEDLIKIKIDKDAFTNIRTFIECVSKVLLLDKLTCDIFIEKWMWLYGTGTVFALEYFPSFMSMITDAYVGAFINNQKTIEKIADRSMVDMSKRLLEIGAGAI